MFSIYTPSRSLFVDLVEDVLAEVTYDADLAGLSYSVVNQIEGLTVSVGGYNDKLGVLVKDIAEKAKNLEVKPDRFAVVREHVSLCIRLQIRVIFNTLYFSAQERLEELLHGPISTSCRLLRKEYHGIWSIYC